MPILPQTFTAEDISKFDLLDDAILSTVSVISEYQLFVVNFFFQYIY
jgi:hypothetical protein